MSRDKRYWRIFYFLSYYTGNLGFRFYPGSHTTDRIYLFVGSHYNIGFQKLIGSHFIFRFQDRLSL